jgi:hypothetical protein
MQKAITAKDYEGDFDGIPVLKYESVLHGEVKKPGLGPCTRSSTTTASPTPASS